LHKVVVVSFDLVALTSDVIKLLLGGVKVSSQLLQISLLSEELLGGRSVLIVEDLLSLQVGTLSSLHEFVTVISISNLEMGESIQERFDLLLTGLDLSIKVVSLSSKFFLLLLTLDNVVSLRVVVLNLSTARLVLANQSFILDSQVLQHVGSLLKLYLDLMLLSLSSLQFRDQNVLMYLDFSLTFLHGHLELVFSIL